MLFNSRDNRFILGHVGYVENIIFLWKEEL